MDRGKTVDVFTANRDVETTIYRVDRERVGTGREKYPAQRVIAIEDICVRIKSASFSQSAQD